MSENQAPGSGAGDSRRPASGATPEVAETEYQQEVTELEAQSATAARLFDVRRIIGGLFVIYGVIVTIAGFTASDADLKKAEDININLWTGLAMLALGLFFLIWQQLRPAVPPVPAAEEQLPRE
ncbi:hypothetical protein SLNWT_4448 [Streptomyces albus]|uniref:Uncharacterized protein n=1 Tax=Streptomyces albus (strain ATCC 21838 / DSM 41398 / FERM P-419 / JCM 4703 / NBRC 107858) TaxID=1081613 RepID=A0A0B5ET35_STRA4|nr:hypothetical protein SLNWT_4448 [Streptomyces albus]AOU79130.1 hypothetical protein SLNHY_4439 [Streptomyces albus]